MASLHKTWYRCDACGKEDDSTDVVANRFSMHRQHLNEVTTEVCADCAYTLKKVIDTALSELRKGRE